MGAKLTLVVASENVYGEFGSGNRVPVSARDGGKGDVVAQLGGGETSDVAGGAVADAELAPLVIPWGGGMGRVVGKGTQDGVP